MEIANKIIEINNKLTNYIQRKTLHNIEQVDFSCSVCGCKNVDSLVWDDIVLICGVCSTPYRIVREGVMVEKILTDCEMEMLMSFNMNSKEEYILEEPLNYLKTFDHFCSIVFDKRVESPLFRKMIKYGEVKTEIFYK